MVITNELVYVLLLSIIFFSILNIIADEPIGAFFGLVLGFVLSFLGMVLSNILILMLAIMIGIGAILSSIVKVLFTFINGGGL